MHSNSSHGHYKYFVSNQKMKTNPFTKPNQKEVSNYSDFAMQKLINASTPEINRF
jgi:hypothetical protein